MQKFRQMNEGFNFVFEVDAIDEQVTRLKQWGQTNQTLVPIVRLGIGADKADWGLPEGMPDSTKLEEGTPDGLGATSIQLEWRRIKQFTDPNSNMKNLPPWKQEMNWLQILEGIHPEEAKVLTAVKDGKLLDLYPKLEKLMEPLGITEYNKPKKKRTPRKKKEK